MNHITYQQLVELSKTANLSYSLELVCDDALKFTNHYHPWSIREPEAEILVNLITRNNLKVGYEICTGVGISSIVTGQAFNYNNGKLVSIDAYVEESFNLSEAYDINTKFIKNAETSDGYRMTKYLSHVLGIENNLILDIGWSPDDVPTSYIKHHGKNKLDYAFIDGGHSPEQIDADVKCLLPFMGENVVIVFHDSLCMSKNTINLIVDHYGFVGYKDYQTKFHLTAFSKGNIVL